MVDLRRSGSGSRLVEGMVVDLEVGNAESAADPDQPKEGPMGPPVEHLAGTTEINQPTGITS